MLMGIIPGETTIDFLKMTALVGHEFKDEKAKKTLGKICESRGITDSKMRRLIELNMDLMVVGGYMRSTKEGDRLTFSGDSEGRYFWRKATFGDRIIDYLFN